ncbi:armadillo repeat-containing protein 2-like [Clavelina lepadiformis]|uniref:armadillo repeat-containing protein 2-like n=1 Tax=Clavelina lepadiformis TaxID=159417 RepID=UPI0040431569
MDPFERPRNKKGKSNNSITNPVQLNRPSSSEIIKDAKRWYEVQKSLTSKRPITPLVQARSLYNGPQKPDSGSRPPSAVSLGPQTFDTNDAPMSARSVRKSRLAPISHLPNVPAAPLMKPGSTPTKAEIRKIGSAPVSSNAPMKAVHGEVVGVDRQRSFAGDGSAAVRYHPTPPMRPRSQKEAPKFKEISSNIPRKQESLRSATSSESIPSNQSSASSSGQTTNDAETAEEALYWNQSVLPHIEQLQELHTEKNTVQLCKSCDQLYAALRNGFCFERMSSRRKTSLLTELYRLLRSGSSELDILCARIVLEVGVRNKNLSNVCKLVYQICRDKKFDDLFIKYQMISPMLDVLRDVVNPISKYENYEAFLYLNGGLKFLSDNKLIANIMYTSNGIGILVQFLNTTIGALDIADDVKKAHKFAESIFVQVCLTFRNLMNMDYKAQQSMSAIPTLATIIRNLRSEQELTWILSRIFSKLSMYSLSVNHFLAERSWPELFLSTLHKFSSLPEIVVHLALALGDLTAQNDQARKELFEHKSQYGPKGSSVSSCVEEMLKLINFYCNVDPESATIKPDQAQDVLIKVVRVIAHLSIGESVGPRLASNARCVEKLLNVLETHNIEDNEELIINILTTLNNLSYYDDGLAGESSDPINNAVSANRLRLVSLLLHLLMVDNMACVAEVTRVFGNLTKHKDVRDLLQKHKIDSMMVTLLDSGDRIVVYSACGVLVNISTDKDKRSGPISEDAVSKLTDVLRDFAPTEWRIGGVACQVLWNLSTDSSFNFPNSLIELLEKLQDYNFVSAHAEEISQDQKMYNYMLLTWKEHFCEFAIPLLRRLKASVYNLIPIDRKVESDISSTEST